jgi:hypothetical protein
MSQQITTNHAPTLDDLAALLNGLHSEEIELARNCDPTLVRVNERYDLTSLPTYGGEEPADTQGIYSWDADRVLYCDGPQNTPWVISPRDEQ